MEHFLLNKGGKLMMIGKVFFWVFKVGTGMQKLVLSIILGWSLMPVFVLIDKYVFGDWNALGYATVLLAVDVITGFAKHWYLKSVSKEGFGKFFKKLIIFTGTFVLSHVVPRMVHDEPGGVAHTAFMMLCYSSLASYLGLSILQSWNVLSDGKFPPDKFYKHFKKGDDDDPTPGGGLMRSVQ